MDWQKWLTSPRHTVNKQSRIACLSEVALQSKSSSNDETEKVLMQYALPGNIWLPKLPKTTRLDAESVWLVKPKSCLH